MSAIFNIWKELLTESQGYNVYVIQSGSELNSEFIRGGESSEYYIL